MVRRDVLKPGDTARQWLLIYCQHLRNVAAGRATDGELDLSEERAGLAREQKLLTELKRRKEEKELAPVSLMTLAIGKVAAQIAAGLDSVPGQIKRACADIPSSALKVVELEIVNARNLASEIKIDIESLDSDS